MRFFVDEDLDGAAFVGPMLRAGIDLVRHRDLFPKGVADMSGFHSSRRRG